MVIIDDQGRPEPPVAADEFATLRGFLDFQRATLRWKTAGLDAPGLRAQLPHHPTPMSLGGIVKHLSWVEQYWFRQRLHGQPADAPWDTVDWESEPDWDWRSAADDEPEGLRLLWEREVQRSRAAVDDAFADAGLGRLAQHPWPDGTAPSLRWILIHMVEEYARHNGHADLLREAFDGGAIGE